jgi:hypothetical protein
MSDKSVLLISPYFPPRKRVGSLRAFKFAKYLKLYGYTPVIISLSTPKEQLSDKELEALSDSHLYQFANPFDQTTQRSGSQFSNNANSNSGNSNKVIQNTSISELFDLWFPIDTWLPVLLPQLARVSSIIEKHHCKLIWSTGDPWSSHVIARILAHNKEIPWVADFRDPWTLCSTRYKNRPSIIKNIDSRSEIKILKEATKVIFTAKTTEQVYKNYYPQFADKFDTIYNSFDQVSSINDTHSSETEKSSKLNFFFFGRFRELSPAYPLMEIFNRIASKDPIILDNIEVSYIGSMRQEDIRMAELMNLTHIFKQVSPILHDKSLSFLNNADLLLLSTDPGRFEIIPAKLWDYLPSNTPIFSIAPNPEIHEILKSTARGVSFSPTDIEASSNYLIDFIRNKNLKSTPKLKPDKSISKYSAIETTAKLASIFDSLLEK